MRALRRWGRRSASPKRPGERGRRAIVTCPGAYRFIHAVVAVKKGVYKSGLVLPFIGCLFSLLALSIDSLTPGGFLDTGSMYCTTSQSG